MDIIKTYVIAAPVTAVWRALTDPDVIEEWGAGPAEMSDAPGTAFSQWGGDIRGTVTEAEPPGRLVEEWYGGDWPEPSIATFALAEEGEATRLTLTHTGVPDDERDDVDRGWDEYYLGPMKELLESW